MHRTAVAVAIVVFALTMGSPAVFGAGDARSRWPVGVTIVKDSPLGPRRSPAIAVRGSRVFVVGGDKMRGDQPVRHMHDGAVLDLRTGDWTRLPDAPFNRTRTTSAQWVGRRMIVAGVTCPGRVGTEHGCSGGRFVAAVYSARSHSWRSLKVPTRLVRGFGSGLNALMTTKSEAWFLDGETFTVAVNPRTGRWRNIPPSLLGGSGSTCSAKRYAAVVGGIRPMGPIGLRLLSVDDGKWGSLEAPDAFPEPSLGGTPSCNSDSVIVVRSNLRAQTCAVGSACTEPLTMGSAVARVLRFDLAAKRWSDIAPPAAPAGGAALGHGRYVDFVANGVPGLRLTTATGTWAPIAPGPAFAESPGGFIWARGVAVTQDRNQLVVYRPE
jgi:hypothetical protein